MCATSQGLSHRRHGRRLMIKLRLKERFIHATGCGHGWELGAMEWNRSGYKEDIPATDTKSHSHFFVATSSGANARLVGLAWQLPIIRSTPCGAGSSGCRRARRQCDLRRFECCMARREVWALARARSRARGPRSQVLYTHARAGSVRGCQGWATERRYHRPFDQAGWS